MNEISEQAVIEAIAAEGGTARLLGGRAIHVLCGEALPALLRRPSADIDLVIDRRSRKALNAAMLRLESEPEREFNLLNGKERMIFYARDTKIDVFIGVFRMCHVLQLENRLTLHPLTLGPADLLLTKLQVVRAERKDLMDAAALLLACGLGTGELNTIDTGYLAKYLGQDWGFWRTATRTLESLADRAAELCGPVLGAALQRHVQELLQVLSAAPKTLGWRARALIGERTPWYELPEEPEIGQPTTA
jgi:hypothetical protein